MCRKCKKKTFWNTYRSREDAETYPQGVPPPALELSYPWALSSLDKKKEMEIYINWIITSWSVWKAFSGVTRKALALQKGCKKKNMWISPSQIGQHLPSGWMVREQDRTGQMTGSQITVRFYRRIKYIICQGRTNSYSCLSLYLPTLDFEGH